MDRELRVMKDGCVLAELHYDYERPTSGKVKILINRIYDLGDDMKSTYPIHQYETYVNHRSAPKSIDELKAYDMELLKREPDFMENFSADLEYVYEPLQYRYVMEQGRLGVVGITEIETDFNADKKEIKFISARRLKEDLNISSNSLEPNRFIITRFLRGVPRLLRH
jgi:hypothetical protein